VFSADTGRVYALGAESDGPRMHRAAALHFHNGAKPYDVPRIRGGRRHLCDGSACCILNGGDQTAQLTVLGTGRLPQPEGGPSVSLLEVFPNRFPHRPYVVSMAFPEYTSLCPVTGQPDFGTIVVEFIPDQKCVESKSFKLYMFAYRNHQSFMESITNTILEDFVEALDPMWCRVKGLFSPRGATYLHVFAEHYKKLDDPAKAEEVRQAVADWKREAAPHTWDK